MLLSEQNLIIMFACYDGIKFAKRNRLFGLELTKSDFDLIESKERTEMHQFVSFIKNRMDTIVSDPDGRIIKYQSYDIVYNDTGFRVYNGINIRREYNSDSRILFYFEDGMIVKSVHSSGISDEFVSIKYVLRDLYFEDGCSLYFIESEQHMYLMYADHVIKKFDKDAIFFGHWCAKHGFILQVNDEQFYFLFKNDHVELNGIEMFDIYGNKLGDDLTYDFRDNKLMMVRYGTTILLELRNFWKNRK